MVRQHPEALRVVEGRDDEPATQHANCQCRVWRATTFGEKLLETLCLAGVVAKNERRESIAHDFAQSFHVAQDRLWRHERKMDGYNLGIGDVFAGAALAEEIGASGGAVRRQRNESQCAEDICDSRRRGVQLVAVRRVDMSTEMGVSANTQNTSLKETPNVPR